MPCTNDARISGKDEVQILRGSRSKHLVARTHENAVTRQTELARRQLAQLQSRQDIGLNARRRTPVVLNQYSTARSTNQELLNNERTVPLPDAPSLNDMDYDGVDFYDAEGNSVQFSAGQNSLATDLPADFRERLNMYGIFNAESDGNRILQGLSVDDVLAQDNDATVTNVIAECESKYPDVLMTLTYRLMPSQTTRT